MTYKFSSNCLKVSGIVFLMLILQSLGAQRNAKEYSTGSFKEVTPLLNNQSKVLGKDFAALVWMDTLVFRKETQDFSARTQAEIGAASSWLTAALVLQFIDEGKLSMDDKVSRFLPEFGKYGKSYVTIRTCLTQMTGIEADEGKLKKLFDKKKFASLEELVNEYASKEIQTNPGTEFRYSIMGMSIAGRVLEVITKKKFDQLAQQRLFRPLGMRNTTFSTIDASAVNPSTGARSTADDYLKFLVMLLNNGMNKEQRILSEASVKLLVQSQIKADQIKEAPKPVQGDDYTLGAWVLESGQNGSAATVSGMSFGGTVSMVDLCRRYAVVLFPKEQMDETKTAAYLNIKKGIDDLLPASRKTGCGE